MINNVWEEPEYASVRADFMTQLTSWYQHFGLRRICLPAVTGASHILPLIPATTQTWQVLWSPNCFQFRFGPISKLHSRLTWLRGQVAGSSTQTVFQRSAWIPSPRTLDRSPQTRFHEPMITAKFEITSVRIRIP